MKRLAYVAAANHDVMCTAQRDVDRSPIYKPLIVRVDDSLHHLMLEVYLPVSIWLNVQSTQKRSLPRPTFAALHGPYLNLQVPKYRADLPWPLAESSLSDLAASAKTALFVTAPHMPPSPFLDLLG